jgi:hypothetical protein
VPGGARERDPHPEEAGAEDPGIGHVEARVAEKRDLAAPEGGDQVAVRARPALCGRERIGIRLAGVQEVGEPVYDRDRGRAGKPPELGVVVGAHDDAVDEAGEDPRRVLDRLAPA